MPNSFFRPFMTNSIIKNSVKSNISITSIITNLEKTISTINQVIPIYKEVKPLVTSSKGVINGITSYFKRNRQTNTNTSNEVIDATIIEKVNKKNEEATINVTSPSKAFFI